METCQQGAQRASDVCIPAPDPSEAELAFTPEERERLEHEYQERYVDLLQSRLTVGFPLAALLTLAYIVLDGVFFRDDFFWFVQLRLGIAGGCLLLLLLNRLTSGRLYQEILTCVGAFVLTAGQEMLIFRTAPEAGHAIIGIFLMLMGAVVLIPIRMAAAMATAIGILALYLIPLLIIPSRLTMAVIMQHFILLLAAALVLLIASHLQRKAYRNQFWLRGEVQMRERQLQRQAEHLEEMVERRTAEVVKSEGRYKSLVESSPGLIFTLGMKGEYTFVGPRCKEMTGYSPEEFLGNYYINFVPKEEHLQCVRIFKRIRDQGKAALDVTHQMIKKDGERRIVCSFTAPYCDEQGRIMGLIGTAVDISQQRRLEQEKEEYRRSLEQALERLQEANLNIIKALAGAIEAKDPYTRGHAERVSQLSLVMAKAMGFNEEELTWLEYAAVLHDVGKIGVKGVVLNKSGPLTDEEYEHIKIHPVLGETILKDVSLLGRTRPLIRAHHERFDGGGYPDGLAGHAIPLHSRIMAVADAFDAMRSLRPYRNPLSREEAVRRIKEGAGSQFDPRVVDVFIRLEAVGELSHDRV